MNAFRKAAVKVLGILPPRVKRSMLHLSYHLTPAEFERFAHVYCIGPSMALGLKALADRGLSPKTIVDVGAYEGKWSLVAHSIWPQSQAIMIEPNIAKHSQLCNLAKKIDGRLFDDLLGACSGQTVAFNLMETGSSIMNENSSVERVIENRILSTLDALHLQLGGATNLLKIDAQGYELEILKGATNSLRSFEAILLEVALIPINDGAPLLHDVTSFMNNLGFVSCEILEIHRRPRDGAMSQVDIIFVRKGSPLLLDCRY